MISSILSSTAIVARVYVGSTSTYPRWTPLDQQRTEFQAYAGFQPRDNAMRKVATMTQLPGDAAQIP